MANNKFEIETKFSKTEEYTTDCIEFCPIPEYQSYLAVGSYELSKSDNLRKGSLNIYKWHENNLNFVDGTNKLGGIFDLKWYNVTIGGKIIVGVATSGGSLQICIVTKDELVVWQSIVLTSSMCLYLDFSDKQFPSNQPLISVSDSNGYIHICQINSNNMTLLYSIKGHNFEAWVSHFSYWNPSIFFSGADDNLFKCYDIRTPESPSAINKSHGSGVTSIETWPHFQNILLTGSYDESVRIFDTRNLSKELNRVKIGGGIWRIKPHLHEPNLFLAACMHEGFKLCSLCKENNSVDIIATYNEHKSLAYGVDWCKTTFSGIVASVSFYDKLIKIWNIDMLI